jgi:hypothetical protein
MATLVTRSCDVSCQFARAENLVEGFGTSCLLELYLETPADRDLKMSRVSTRLDVNYNMC